MKLKIKHYIRDMSLFAKILTIIIILNIFFIGIVSTISIRIVTSANNRLLYQSIAGSLSASAKNIESELDRLQSMTNIIISNEVIQKQLSRLEDDGENIIARREIFERLYTVLNSYYFEFNKNHIDYMTLSNDFYTTYTYTSAVRKPSLELLDDLNARAEVADGAPVWTTSYTDDHGLFLSRTVRRIENLQLTQLGILNVCVDLEGMILANTDFSSQYDESAFLMYNGDQLIYHSPSLTESDARNLTDSLTDSYGIVRLNNRLYFAVKGLLPNYKWNYICLVSYEKTAAAINLSLMIYSLVILISIIVSIFLSYIFVHLITKHLDNLVLKMQTFRGSTGELVDIDYDYSERGDELGILHRQFDSMAEEIHDLIHVNYTTQLLAKDSQIKALEAQINPHFLYNVLESVNWRAKLIGEHQISLMVESLGKLLRATLSNSVKDFTLKDELDLVDSYMAIQAIRFDELLDFQSTVPESLLDALIPKLTLQPILENAIRYALEQNPDGCAITLTAVIQDANLTIYIKNSGSSFPDNLIYKLRTQEVAPHGFGIGLLNIDDRIKLVFGNEYGLSFYNEGPIAVAKITIPYKPPFQQEETTPC